MSAAQYKLFIFILIIINFLSNDAYGHGFASNTRIYVSVNKSVPMQLISEDSLDESQRVLSFYLKEKKHVRKKVRSAATVQTDCYYAIELNHEPWNEILCTPDQLFYVPTNKQWIAACNLHENYFLLTKDNTTVAITAIRFVQQPLLCYAIRVKKFHNFFVGKHGVLAHNILLPVITATLGPSFGGGATSGCLTGAAWGPIGAVAGILLGGCIGMVVKSICAPTKLPHYDIRYPGCASNVLFAEAEKNSDIQAHGMPTEENCQKPRDSKNKAVPKSPEDLIKDAQPGEKTNGKAKQFKKPGGFLEALNDFEDLNPRDIKDIPIGKIGYLPDGRTANVRRESSYDKKPTLEIYNPKNKRSIKIRYVG